MSYQAKVDLIVAREELKRLREQNAAMLEALKDVMHLIECGWLVRNTANDADPDWAINQLKPTLMLQKAQAAIAAAEPETNR